MNISRRIMLVIGAVALGLGVALVSSGGNKRTVALLFRDVEVDRDGLAARLEFTNSTRRTVGYEGNSYRPEYRLLEATNGGWKETYTTATILHMGTLASVPRPRNLAPSTGIVFQVGIPHRAQETKHLKVEVTYSYLRPTNGVWKFLPQWLWTHSPWGKGSYTLESPTFMTIRSQFHFGHLLSTYLSISH